MKPANLVRAMLVLALLAVAAQGVWAQGVILPDDMPNRRPGVPWIQQFPMVIKSVRADIVIENQTVTTTFEQVFENPNNFQIQGQYMFPLPNNGTVSDLSMWIDGKEQKGELLDVDRARQIYEDYVRRSIDPALLEYVGTQMYKLRIFPIPPRSERRIKISYSEVIPQSAGLVTYRYPLNVEKFTTRPLDEAVINVTIKSNSSIKTVYSPSHSVDIVRKDEKNVRVGMEAKHAKADKDFLLYYSTSSNEMGVNLVTFKKTGEDGYFMLMVSPGLEKSKPMPKDVVLVMDTSGSMADNDKIGQAKKSLEYCVNSFEEGDRFNIISFSTEAREFEKSLVDVSKTSKERAVEYIKGLRAAGGTNINEALLKAIDMAPKEGSRPYMIVFVTDGQPTVDERDPNQILKNVAMKNAGKVRLFVFGVGHDVNTHLLDKLAEQNRGSRDYISPDENIETKVGGFYQKVANPVIADAKIDFGSIKVYDTYPKMGADIFSGSQVIMFGRYTGDGSTAVQINGKTVDGDKRLAYDVNFKGGNEGEYIPRLWAVSKIGYLLDDIRLRGENAEVKREIVELAKKFGIITPYTSYLVQEDFNTNPRPMPVPMMRALESGAGGGGRFREEARKGGEEFDMAKKPAGDKATGASQDLKEMQSAPEKADGEGYGGVYKDIASAIKTVGEKTFYLADGVWYDSTYKPETKTTKVKAMSDEYFKLIKEKPALARYFALGSRVIVLHEGAAYEVTE